MQRSYDPGPAAHRLRKAWRSNILLEDLPEEERPTDVPEGYAVQAALVRELGEDIAGYKLGLSSESAMRRTGLGCPASGFVTASRVKASGETVAGQAAGPVLVEVEIAFSLAHSIAPGEHVADPKKLISQAYLAVELVRSRFRDRTTIGLPSFLGDSVGFFALVLGDRIDLSAPDALQGPAELLLDGMRVAGPFEGPERTDPLSAFELFLRDAARRRLPLAAGALVSTGTLVQPFESSRSGRYEARLGTARVTFGA